MQITITEEQVKIVREALEIIVWPTLGWFIRNVVKQSRLAINKIITDNVNRITNELKDHIDDKFMEHETNAFEKLDEIENKLKEFEKALNESNRILRGKGRNDN